MSVPPDPSERPLLFLRIRVDPERRDDLLRFLREAVPIYESLPGTRVRLLRNRREPDRWIEVVEYPDEATYARDQQRVEEDPRMLALLDRWHAILDGPVEVETWDDWTAHLEGDRR